MGRDISQCHPRVQILADQLVKKCAEAGLKIKITDCFRSKAEQDALYAQGRTLPGSIVTNAKGSSYSSFHMWGTAFDFCRNDGRGAFYDADGFFAEVGKIGKSLGLEWGGDWKKPVDKPHFQLPDWGSTTRRIKQVYGTPDAFRRTWGGGSGVTAENSGKVEYKMPTIKQGSTGRAVKIWQVIVGSEPDGIFGKDTVNRTKQFQQSAGLAVDGIVGKKSWAVGLGSV